MFTSGNQYNDKLSKGFCDFRATASPEILSEEMENNFLYIDIFLGLSFTLTFLAQVVLVLSMHQPDSNIEHFCKSVIHVCTRLAMFHSSEWKVTNVWNCNTSSSPDAECLQLRDKNKDFFQYQDILLYTYMNTKSMLMD